jgi:hypothetical protein
VLGDKSNHQATLHGALVLYFFAVALVFLEAYLRCCVRSCHIQLSRRNTK